MEKCEHAASQKPALKHIYKYTKTQKHKNISFTPTPAAKSQNHAEKHIKGN